MNFGEWRNAVVILQRDSGIVGERHLGNRCVQSDAANVLDQAFWSKVFPTRHFKPVVPELLAGLQANQVMPIAEAIHDFELSRFQCS